MKRVLPAIPESPRQVFADYAFEQWWVPGSGSALFAAEPTLKVELCEQAWQLWRDTLGDDHPYTLNSAHKLALLLRTLGEYERARDVDEDTLAPFRRVPGDDHPHILVSASNLAGDLRALGDGERALVLDRSTWSRFRRVLGNDHLHTLISANNLASDLRALAEWEKARELDEDTLARLRQVLGDDDLHTLRQPPTWRATYARWRNQNGPGNSTKTPWPAFAGSSARTTRIPLSQPTTSLVTCTC